MIGVASVACAPSDPAAQTTAEIDRISAEVIPEIEQVVGLEFRDPPVIETREREAVMRYLIAKLDADLPADLLARVVTAYRLFGLVPDTLDVRALMLDVLSEQVVGYYDPDSAALYVVEGTDPFQIRLVLAHELVHALQGQYMDLNGVMQLRRQNDRRMAGHAVLEGQATYALLKATLSADQLAQLGDLWDQVRRALRNETFGAMPAFSSAPLIIREGLLFPYLAGSEFMRWFESAYPDTVPFGRRLPTSTEQILHPERYRDGDHPVTLRFAADGALYEDTWGEFETRLVLQELTGSKSMGRAGALGWDGDRFAVFADGADHALVWWTVWDSEQAAEKFARMLERSWPERRARPGRRSAVERVSVDGIPGVRLVDAPEGWAGWAAIPQVRVVD